MDLAARGPSAVVRAALLVATACLVTGASSCSRSSDSTSEPTATLTSDPPATTSTTTIEDVEADVEAAYLAAFEAYYDAVEHPDDPNDLEATHMGPSFERAVAFIEDLKQRNQRATFPDGRPRTSVVDITVEGDEAAVTACERDASVVVQLPGNETVDDDAVSARTLSTLRHGIDGWKVVDLEIVRTWNDDLGCDRS